MRLRRLPRVLHPGHAAALVDPGAAAQDLHEDRHEGGHAEARARVQGGDEQGQQEGSVDAAIAAARRDGLKRLTGRCGNWGRRIRRVWTQPVCGRLMPRLDVSTRIEANRPQRAAPRGACAAARLATSPQPEATINGLQLPEAI